MIQLRLYLLCLYMTSKTTSQDNIDYNSFSIGFPLSVFLHKIESLLFVAAAVKFLCEADVESATGMKKVLLFTE